LGKLRVLLEKLRVLLEELRVFQEILNELGYNIAVALSVFHDAKGVTAQ
jgi:hypothetical protein